ncbi:hypothetical protein [Hyphococcus lacteus]|uniref:Uncharacterized protein n=1 Tax=Hyphococcus lacteus TaxID=3143536 RepID=A0ABV3Z1X1_9PROT
MILRRITEHVKAQNWFAVFLDFIIVVVGVFIGIQVANWNDAQQSNAQVADLMTRMVSEATTTRSEMARYKEFHQEIYNNAFQLALALKDKETCIAMGDELTILIIGISDFPPPRFSLSNAEQAMETGSMAHIQSAGVRTGIQTITDEMEFIDRQWQRYVSVKQNANQEAHRAAGVSLTGRGEMDWGASVGYDANSYELLTPENICGDTEIVALAANVAVLQKIYVNYLREVEKALDDYLATLSEGIEEQ